MDKTMMNERFDTDLNDWEKFERRHLVAFVARDDLSASPQRMDGLRNEAATASSSPRRSQQQEQYPPGYKPNQYDVICAKGHQSQNAEGNRRLRQLIKERVHEYSITDSKRERSQIVSRVIQEIRDDGGNFIRYSNGRWVNVKHSAVREKVSSRFRDVLHTKYPSSATAKNAKRAEQSMLQRKNKRAHALRQDASTPCQSLLMAAQAFQDKISNLTEGLEDATSGDDDDDEIGLVQLCQQSAVLEAPPCYTAQKDYGQGPDLNGLLWSSLLGGGCISTLLQDQQPRRTRAPSRPETNALGANNDDERTQHQWILSSSSSLDAQPVQQSSWSERAAAGDESRTIHALGNFTFFDVCHAPVGGTECLIVS